MYSREQMLRVCVANEQFSDLDHDKVTAAMIRQLLASEERLRAALEKLKSYNEDIRDERINYRPEDHIAVAREALK